MQIISLQLSNFLVHQINVSNLLKPLLQFAALYFLLKVLLTFIKIYY